MARGAGAQRHPTAVCEITAPTPDAPTGRTPRKAGGLSNEARWCVVSLSRVVRVCPVRAGARAPRRARHGGRGATRYVTRPIGARKAKTTARDLADLYSSYTHIIAITNQLLKTSRSAPPAARPDGIADAAMGRGHGVCRRAPDASKPLIRKMHTLPRPPCATPRTATTAVAITDRDRGDVAAAAAASCCTRLTS